MLVGHVSHFTKVFGFGFVFLWPHRAACRISSPTRDGTRALGSERVGS